MDSILKKSEIADLLNAIREGKVSLDPDENEQSSFLTCSPINLSQLARLDKEQFRIPNFDIIVDGIQIETKCSIGIQFAVSSHYRFSASPTTLPILGSIRYYPESVSTHRLGLNDPDFFLTVHNDPSGCFGLSQSPTIARRTKNFRFWYKDCHTIPDRNTK